MAKQLKVGQVGWDRLKAQLDSELRRSGKVPMRQLVEVGTSNHWRVIGGMQNPIFVLMKEGIDEAYSDGSAIPGIATGVDESGRRVEAMDEAVKPPQRQRKRKNVDVEADNKEVAESPEVAEASDDRERPDIGES